MDFSSLSVAQMEVLLLKKQLEIAKAQGAQGAQGITVTQPTAGIQTTAPNIEKGKQWAHADPPLTPPPFSPPQIASGSKAGPPAMIQHSPHIRDRVDNDSATDDETKTIDEEDDIIDTTNNTSQNVQPQPPSTSLNGLPTDAELADHNLVKTKHLEWFSLLVPNKDLRCAIRMKMRQACARKWDSGQTWKDVTEMDRAWAVLHISKAYPLFTAKYHGILRHLMMNHLTQKKSHDKEQASKLAAATDEPVAPTTAPSTSKASSMSKALPTSNAPSTSKASSKSKPQAKKAVESQRKKNKAPAKEPAQSASSKRKRGANGESSSVSKKAKTSKAPETSTNPAVQASNAPVTPVNPIQALKASEILVDPTLLEEDRQRALSQQRHTLFPATGHRQVRSGIPISEPPYGPPSPDTRTSTPPPGTNSNALTDVTRAITGIPQIPDDMLPLSTFCSPASIPPAPKAVSPSIKDRSKRRKPRRKVLQREVNQGEVSADPPVNDGTHIVTAAIALAPLVAPAKAGVPSGGAKPSAAVPSSGLAQKRGRELAAEPIETTKRSKPNAQVKPPTKAKGVKPAVAGPGPSTQHNTRSRLVKQEQIAMATTGE